MLAKVSYPAGLAAALLDDQARSFATDDYLLPFLQLTQDSLETEALKLPDLNSLTGVVVIPDVPAFTVDLADYFASEQPLELLTEVLGVKERAATGTRQDRDFWHLAPVRDLPTMGPTALDTYYSWDGSTIKLIGADQTVDIRIFGKFKATTLKDGNSPIVPGTSEILAFGAASIVAASRGNDSMADRYEAKRLSLQQSFISNAILELQAVRTRMRSYSGRGNVYR